MRHTHSQIANAIVPKTSKTRESQKTDPTFFETVTRAGGMTQPGQTTARRSHGIDLDFCDGRA
jgi:hypothetical protein